ncbi:methionine--tRNA ligase subunit beta [Granulicella sp. WH15]|uniref:methionine--tRNA ligase subunit beta n=1 Tax=Granulicella sp. WH15 TaxID=2602070 RepID=UPI001367325F|nr:methionine--tRNA ligase subunit beta [Granulicella sp. WH15]QHN03822.1 methionine--tRNA ligase subunit beta [Granulicella sp. WH15]
MPSTEKFYLTTPIYYVNARPHIGHAYTTIVADVIARRHRLLGHDTRFLTGTDEHGQKIERSALAAGIPPQQFTDEVSREFRQLWDRMGLTYDDYIRTTEPRHKIGAQKLFADLHARGQIYLSTYTGQYSVGEEIFVEGPPGVLGPDGRPTETVTEENFFFKLSEYQLPLIDLIESDGLHIQSESRKNEVLSFLRGNLVEARESGSAIGTSKLGNQYVIGALRDLSVSRSSFTWGIPVPEPAASETQQKHIIYVWLDALANYMTAVGYGSDKPEDKACFERYWPADVHLMSKEITRQHCIYWPAFLMAAKLPTPKSVTAHGWLLFEESKMSKSKGNIVRAETVLDAFGEHVYGKQFPDSTKHERDLFSADVLRYHLLREIPFGQDGSFSFDAMITRYNADLANGYGNLASRTLSLIVQNLDGIVPSVSAPQSAETDAVINELLSFSEIDAHYESSRFDQLTQTISARIKTVDVYLSSHAPWKLAKSEDPADLQKMVEVLYTAAESIRILTALLFPFLPNATAKVWAQLGLGDIEAAARNGELNNLAWGGLKPGTPLGTLSPIFPRADKGLAQIMTEVEASAPSTKPATEQPAAETTPAPAVIETAPEPTVTGPADASPQITIDDFAKVELRVAQVLVCERIPKADKLLRLEVDLGYEKRQILSGIAEWYTPEEMIGRKIVVITNLAPRKMRGLESHGMLLAASEGEGGKPVLATFGEEIAVGSRLK